MAGEPRTSIRLKSTLADSGWFANSEAMEQSCRQIETRSCPAGYEGSETWLRTRTYYVRDYRNPVPHRADYRIEDSESDWSAWQKWASNCTLIVNTGNTGYSSDDDDDDNGKQGKGN